MYLKDTQSGNLVEVVDLKGLIDPTRDRFHGRYHSGEELQEVAVFSKASVSFPSGEKLPECWVNAHYRG